MRRTDWQDAMAEALTLAREAAAAGEVPVGAVVLNAGGEIVGRGCNRREALGDPLAHAEVEAMRDAASAGIGACGGLTGSADRVKNQAEPAAVVPRKTWNLKDCTLVVTLEPCPMCAGAALQAHVGRIVFGAWDAKLGACGSVWDIPRDPHVGARPEVIGGVRESECAALLADFFVSRR